MNQIESEAAEMAGVEIDPEIEELVRKIEGMDDTLKIQGKVVGELTNRRSLIDDSGEAADAMTRAQQSLAAVAVYADEYIQHRVSRHAPRAGDRPPTHRISRRGKHRVQVCLGHLRAGRHTVSAVQVGQSGTEKHSRRRPRSGVIAGQTVGGRRGWTARHGSIPPPG